MEDSDSLKRYRVVSVSANQAFAYFHSREIAINMAIATCYMYRGRKERMMFEVYDTVDDCAVFCVSNEDYHKHLTTEFENPLKRQLREF